MSDVIGILPAAGAGSRLGNIPCSKEIMPLGFQSESILEEAGWHPVTAIETHLRAFQLAGVNRVALIVSETKYDIVRYLGNGERFDLSLSYFYQEQLRGMPFALDLVSPWVGTSMTLFSMPDTLITPLDTMSRLVAHHQQTNAALTLGLFHTDKPEKFGMVELSETGQVVDFIDKPTDTELDFMWGLAVWSTEFTHFMTHHLAAMPAHGPEYVLSDVFLAALREGLSIEAFVLGDAHYHDIGTPEDFQAAVYELALQEPTSAESALLIQKY